MLVFAADVLTPPASAGVGDWRKALRPVMLVFLLFAALDHEASPTSRRRWSSRSSSARCSSSAAIRARHLAVIGGAAIAAVTLFALLVPWRRARMLAFLDPWHDKSNTGYQVTQSLIALGSGGWTGVGLGASRAKWRFLPAAHTDFIFAIVGEELGLFGCALVIGLFGALAYLGVRTALRAPGPVRDAARRRRHRVDRRAGGHQHRVGRRAAAGLRGPAAVRLVRRDRAASSR